jgi:hypothetical protein
MRRRGIGRRGKLRVVGRRRESGLRWSGGEREHADATPVSSRPAEQWPKDFTFNVPSTVVGVGVGVVLEGKEDAVDRSTVLKRDVVGV